MIINDPVRITKTCLYNFEPCKPDFYIVKMGFTGVYIIFLISAQNIDYEYSLQPPRWGGSNEYPQSVFRGRNMKNIRGFYLKCFSFGGEFSIYLNRACFRNEMYSSFINCYNAPKKSITSSLKNVLLVAVNI